LFFYVSFCRLRGFCWHVTLRAALHSSPCVRAAANPRVIKNWNHTKKAVTSVFFGLDAKNPENEKRGGFFCSFFWCVEIRHTWTHTAFLLESPSHPPCFVFVARINEC